MELGQSPAAEPSLLFVFGVAVLLAQRGGLPHQDIKSAAVAVAVVDLLNFLFFFLL